MAAFPILRFLWGQKEFPLRSKQHLQKSERYEVAKHLLYIYKEDYTVLNSLVDKEFTPTIKKVSACYREIQNNLSQNIPYTPYQFPNTQAVIQSYFGGADLLGAFSRLKEDSFGILPFSQRVLCYFSPEHEAFERLEKVKQIGVRILFQKLEEVEKSSLIEDDNKEENPCNVSDQELGSDFSYKTVLTQAAVGDDVHFYTFSDLITTYFSTKPIGQPARIQKALFSFANWPLIPGRVVEKYKEIASGSFKEFLTSCSLEKIEDNLGFEIPLDTKEALSKAFLGVDSTRLDTLYFSKNIRFIYTQDWRKSPRFSKHEIVTLQIHMFFVRKYGVSLFGRPSLFQLIYARTKWFDPDLSIPGFQERQLSDPGKIFEDLLFTQSRAVLYSCFDAVEKQEVAAGSALESRCLQNESALTLLATFLKLPLRAAWGDFFKILSGIANIKLTIPSILAFVKENQNTVLTKKLADSYLGNYKEIVSCIESHLAPFQEVETLFFSPPMLITNELTEKMETALKLLPDYLTETLQYKLENRQYAVLIRNFVEKGEEAFFSLELLKKALIYIPDEKRGQELIFFCLMHPSKKGRNSSFIEEALRQADSLRRSYEFSFPQFISLAFEFVFLHTIGKVYEIRKIQQFLIRLNTLAIPLEPDQVYYLFRNYPDIPSSFTQFVERQKKWAKNQEMLNRFLFPIEVVLEATAEIETSVAAIAYPAESYQDLHRLLKALDKIDPPDLKEKIQYVRASITKLVPYLQENFIQELLSWSDQGGKNKGNFLDETLEMAMKAVDAPAPVHIAPSQEESEREEFIAGLKQAFGITYFLPWQRIRDFFRISAVTADGVTFNSKHLQSHDGQLFRLSSLSSKYIYLAWNLEFGRPSLTISVLDTKTMSVRSIKERLKIEVDLLQDAPSIAPSPTHQPVAASFAIASGSSAAVLAQPSQETLSRKAFYTMLHLMGVYAFHKEEVDSTPPDYTDGDLDSALDSFTGWRDTLGTHIEEQLSNKGLTQAAVDAAWDFIVRVKKSARRVYFSLLEEELEPEILELPPMEIAAQGNIYPYLDRTILLPPPYWLEEPLEFYTSCSSLGFIEECQKLFQTSLGRTLLKERLSVTYHGKKRVEVPVYLQVRTAEEVVGEALDKKQWDGRAHPYEKTVSSRYVTLSFEADEIDRVAEIRVPLAYPEEVFNDPSLFEEYFDFQWQTLKSMWYQHNLSNVQEKVLRCRELFSRKTEELEAFTIDLKNLDPSFEESTIVFYKVSFSDEFDEKETLSASSLTQERETFQVTLYDKANKAFLKDYPRGVLNDATLFKEALCSHLKN